MIYQMLVRGEEILEENEYGFYDPIKISKEPIYGKDPIHVSNYTQLISEGYKEAVRCSCCAGLGIKVL